MVTNQKLNKSSPWKGTVWRMEKSLQDLSSVRHIGIVLSVQLVLAVFNAIQVGRQKNCIANDDNHPSHEFNVCFVTTHLAEVFPSPFSNTTLQNEQENQGD